MYQRAGNISGFLLTCQMTSVLQIPFLGSTEKLEVFHYGDEDEGHSEERFICLSCTAS